MKYVDMEHRVLFNVVFENAREERKDSQMDGCSHGIEGAAEHYYVAFE